MKRIVIIIICLHYSAFAQEKICGSTKRLNQYIEQNPEVRLIREKLEKQTENYINRKTINITIPVVVHIVYKNNNENISDLQIQSQIDVLNQDFTHTNPDAVNTPIDFVQDVGNMQINFCLAKQTPNGQPTNGIIRKQTTEPFFPVYSNKISFDSTGGSSAWNTQKYLNIWVCKVEDGFLGWAQFPGAGIQETDGVIIDFEHFGTMGTVITPYTLGRTTTHELGHWFNLLHIWGDNTCGDDLVHDTPIQEEANFGCKIHPHVSCNNNGDMFMNFMDYTNDACMNTFTKGQKTRAWSTISNYRLGLITSDGCDDVIISNSDAGIIDILDPNNQTQDCSSPIYPKVVIKNYSTTTLNTAFIKYRIDTSSYYYQQWNGNLQYHETDTILLSAINTNGTTHLLSVSTINPNNSIDIDTTNDKYVLTYTSLDGQMIELKIITDNYGNETSWKLIKNNGTLIQMEDSLQSNTLYNHILCLPVGCYTFIIYDSFGDGLCCNSGNGEYSISFENGSTIATGGQFTFNDSVSFCIGNPTNLVNNQKDRLNIYPNPTTGKLWLNSGILGNNNIILAKVFNTMGSLILETSWDTNNPLDLSQNKEGIYFIKCVTNNSYYSKKVIIKK